MHIVLLPIKMTNPAKPERGGEQSPAFVVARSWWTIASENGPQVYTRDSKKLGMQIVRTTAAGIDADGSKVVCHVRDLGNSATAVIGNLETGQASFMHTSGEIDINGILIAGADPDRLSDIGGYGATEPVPTTIGRLAQDMRSAA